MVQEKDSPLRSSLLETERRTIFYCNSHTAILNPQRTRETQFLRKLFARPAFSRKSGQFCVALTGFAKRGQMRRGLRRSYFASLKGVPLPYS